MTAEARKRENVKHTSLRVCDEKLVSGLKAKVALIRIGITYPQVGEYDAINR